MDNDNFKCMKTGNDNKKSTGDPTWVFLSEYLLSGFIAEDVGSEQAVGLLLQAIRDFGIPPACLLEIEKTLTGFAQETIVQINHGRSGLPVTIRLFCQKRMIKEKENGGWGYFFIERGGEYPVGSSTNAHNLVDLYLYKEGE